MSELRSKCCGAEVIPITSWVDTGTSDSKSGWYCSWCGKQCEVEEKEEEEE